VSPDGQNSQVDIQWSLFLDVFDINAMTDDFFSNRLDPMIDLRHPLAVLTNRIPWQEIEASLAQRWACQDAVVCWQSPFTLPYCGRVHKRTSQNQLFTAKTGALENNGRGRALQYSVSLRNSCRRRRLAKHSGKCSDLLSIDGYSRHGGAQRRA